MSKRNASPRSAGLLFQNLFNLDDRTSANPAARAPGRPKTRTDAHYAALLQEYAHLTSWFAETFGRLAKSDAELLTAHITAGLRLRGMRESRATSPDVRRKLKTLRNELSTARRLLKPYPENPLLPGLTRAHSSDMQARALTSKEFFYAS